MAQALARQQEARGAPRKPRSARPARGAGRGRDRHRAAGGSLRRPALRAVQGARPRSWSRARARGAARPAGGARLLGGLGRSRLRRGPLGHACSTTRAQLRTLRYDAAREPLGRPASRHHPRRHDRGLVDELARRAARRAPPRRVLELVAACYRPGETLARAFARLLSRAPARARRPRPLRRRAQGADGARARRELAESSPTSRLAARGGPGAARRRLPPAGAGAAGLPEPVRWSWTASAARSAMRERHRRGAGHARRCRSPRRSGGSRATRAPGARARSCARSRRTRCCPPPPTSAGRPRSPTTRRSARPTRTSASRARCCCRGRA